MSKNIKLRKGLDINLVGRAERTVAERPLAASYAVSPLDYENVTPKLLVKVGDRVKAGNALFFDKNNPRVLFTSPVSGTVSAVNRGEKRKLLNVVVDADAVQEYEQFESTDLGSASREQIVETMLSSGIWTRLVQRPFGLIADPEKKPKAIFVSAFDSAPLAPEYDFVLAGCEKELQRGFDVLARLTDGKVHLSALAGREGFVAGIKGVEHHTFEGKHPAGNVGVQIHHIDPVAKGEIVWSMNIQDVAVLGRLFLTGRLDMSKTVARRSKSRSTAASSPVHPSGRCSTATCASSRQAPPCASSRATC